MKDTYSSDDDTTTLDRKYRRRSIRLSVLNSESRKNKIITENGKRQKLLLETWPEAESTNPSTTDTVATTTSIRFHKEMVTNSCSSSDFVLETESSTLSRNTTTGSLSQETTPVARTAITRQLQPMMQTANASPPRRSKRKSFHGIISNISSTFVEIENSKEKLLSVKCFPINKSVSDVTPYLETGATRGNQLGIVIEEDSADGKEPMNNAIFSKPQDRQDSDAKIALTNHSNNLNIDKNQSTDQRINDTSNTILHDSLTCMTKSRKAATKSKRRSMHQTHEFAPQRTRRRSLLCAPNEVVSRKLSTLKKSDESVSNDKPDFLKENPNVTIGSIISDTVCQVSSRHPVHVSERKDMNLHENRLQTFEPIRQPVLSENQQQLQRSIEVTLSRQDSFMQPTDADNIMESKTHFLECSGSFRDNIDRKNWSLIPSSQLLLLSTASPVDIIEHTTDQMQLDFTSRDMEDSVISTLEEKQTFRINKQLSRTGACPSEPQFDSSLIDKHETTPYKFRSETPYCDITTTLINNRGIILFSNEIIANHPCISARLFACFTLCDDSVGDNFRGNAKPFNFPLIDFLQSLVRVEAVSLRPIEKDFTYLGTLRAENGRKEQQQGQPRDENSPPNAEPTRTKRIHFSGIDCSSTLPPVDRVGGSEFHQEESINAMVTMLERIEDLEKLYQNDAKILHYLDKLIHFFRETLAGERNHLKDVCAEAVDFQFAPSRIESARKIYLRDFETLRNRLARSCHPNSKTSADLESLHVDTSDSYLSAEKRLADFVGQTIRFYLRMFLNPQPPRLCRQDETYDLKADCYSKVSTLVKMALPIDGQSTVALDDACISALVSIALQRVYEFCGPEALYMMTENAQSEEGRQIKMVVVLEPEVPKLFCTRYASQRHVSIRPVTVTYFDADDLDEIEADIGEATTFIAAAKACRFLTDLFNTKGVQNEIQRLGGWSKVEAYAKISRRFKLWRMCESDAHLVPLYDIEALFSRLQKFCVLLEPVVPSCERALESLAKRLRVSTKSKSVLKLCPELIYIIDALDKSLEIRHSIPVIVGKSKQKTKK